MMLHFELIVAVLAISMVLQLSLVDAKISQTHSALEYSIEHSMLDSSDLKALETLPAAKASALNKLAPDHFDSGLLFGNLNLQSSEFIFNQSNDNLAVHFGLGSTIWLLAANKSPSNQVYLSQNSGLTYKRYNQFHDYSLESEISQIFVNPIKKDFVIFSDENDKTLFISKNNGRTLKAVRIPFQPSKFHFGQRLNTILAVDQANQQLWLSINMGKSWKMLADNLIQYSETVSSNFDESEERIFFMQQAGSDVRLIEFNLKEFRKDLFNEDVELKKHIIKQGISSFKVSGDKMFIMSKDSKGSMSLSFSENNGQLVEITFPLDHKIVDYQIALVTDAEVYVVVVYEANGSRRSDLFLSKNGDLVKFKLSLKNIVNNCQGKEFEPENPRSVVVDLNMNRCIEMRSLSKDGVIYVANALNSNEMVETFIKRSEYSEWTPIEYEIAAKDLSLNLNEAFFQVHEQPSGSFGPNLPDLMVSRVNQRLNNKNAIKELGVYVSQDEGRDWTKILDEDYIYSITYNEEYMMSVITAVLASKPTNKVLYSYDYGGNWNEYFFSDRFVKANSIFRDPREHSTAFYLACTYAKNIDSIIKIDFHAQELSDDYFDAEILKEEPIPVVDDVRTTKLKALSSMKTEYASTTKKPLADEQASATEDAFGPIVFNLHEPESISETSFKLFYSVHTHSSIRVNNYMLRVFSFNDQESHNISDFKIMDSAEPARVSSEKLIKTNDEIIQVMDLIPNTVYATLFYVNVTQNDENYLKLLDKQVLIRTHQLSVDGINLILLCLMIFPTIAILAVLWMFLMHKKQAKSFISMRFDWFFEKTKAYRAICPTQEPEILEQIKRPIVRSEDRQFLIDRNDDCDSYLV